MTKIDINKVDYEELEEQQRSKSRSKKKIRKMRTKEEK